MGDRTFDEQVVSLAPRLHAFIRRRVADDATAADLTQELLLKVYRSRASLKDDTKLAAWLYRIARTTLIDHYRQRRPNEELPATLQADSPDEMESFRSVMIRTTQLLLERLPERYREPVRLAEIEGLPLARIALRLALSLTAVKSRVRRGRAKLKAGLQDCCRFEYDSLGKPIACEPRPGCGCPTHSCEG